MRGFDAPPEAIDTVIRLTRAASIDVGGVEYLVSKADGKIYYYDVNATSNFVANAPAVVGFDPTARFVDYIVRVAQRVAEPLAPSLIREPRDRPNHNAAVGHVNVVGATG